MFRQMRHNTASMSRPSLLTPERALLLTAIVGAIVYARDLTYDFILDDVPLILMNPAISSWRNLKTIFLTHIFAGGDTPVTSIHYRPLYMSWLLLNHTLFGMTFPWWHLTSLLLHLAVAYLVYALAAKVLGQPWLAYLAAALFLLHPIHAEAVCYVTASSDELVALFSLAALLLYFRYREGGHVAFLAASVAGAAAAILCKESAIVFPLLLVAYEAALAHAAQAEPRGWKNYLRILPFFAVAAGYVAVRTVLFGFNAGPGPGENRLVALRDAPLAILIYLRNLFLPTHLSFYYPPEWSTGWTAVRTIALIVALLVVVLIWKRHKAGTPSRLLLLWTAVLFIPPVLALTTFGSDEWVHDRHVYLASIPFCLLIASLLAELCQPARRLVFAAAPVLLMLAVATWYQLPKFRDEPAVYASAITIAPTNATLRFFHANALWNFARYEQALDEFRAVTRLEPDSPRSHANYARCLAELGRNSEALGEFRKALQLAPQPSPLRASILYRTGVLEDRLSLLDDANSHLREATQMAPDTLNYHAALAEVLRKQGNPHQAQEELQVEATNRKLFLESRKKSQR